MSDRISVPSRFNGPLESGHGGYCAGVFAGLVDGLAQVSLRRPVPLDAPLDAVRESDGTARLLDGEALVGGGGIGGGARCRVAGARGR